MVKVIGSVIIIILSFMLSFIYSENMRKRVCSIAVLAELVEYIMIEIQMFKKPLEEIYEGYGKRSSEYIDFFQGLGDGIYSAAEKNGLLTGDEEREIIRLFDEKIGHGSADEMVNLCDFTSKKLRKLEEKLKCDLPEKQKVYRTVFVLAGVSAVIVLI